MAILGIIPARGGSKGVPRKNLYRIGGRSLIERAVDALINSKVADFVVVSTDDEEIAEAARIAGAEVPFLRPSEMATDTVSVIPSVMHAVHELERMKGVSIETLVLTEPTIPFRTPAHLQAAYEMYLSGDFLSVISVCPLERKPQNIFRKVAGRSLERLIKDASIRFTCRQEMGSLCRLSSGVYVVARHAFEKSQSLVVDPIGFVEVSGMESVNIDEEVDLLLAEAIARKYGF